MDGDRQDAPIAGEGRLHPVSMMGIEIDIEDTAEAAIQEAQDSERHVIEIAKAAGAVASAMMGAAGEMMDDPSIRQQQLRGLQSPPAARGRPPEHLRKDRIAVDAEIVSPPRLGIGALRAFGRLQRGQVIRRMEAAELVEGGLGAHDILILLEPAHRADQVQRRRDAGDRQGMAASIAGAPIDVVRDQARTGRHGRSLERRRSHSKLGRLLRRTRTGATSGSSLGGANPWLRGSGPSRAGTTPRT